MLQCLQSSEYSAKVPPAGCPQQTNNTCMPSQSVFSGVWTPEPKVQTRDNFPINVQTESLTSISSYIGFWSWGSCFRSWRSLQFAANLK
jgi:hypothetical protein